MATMILRAVDNVPIFDINKFGGAHNYSCINEVECDGDSTYLYAKSDDLLHQNTMREILGVTENAPPDNINYSIDDIRIYSVARKTSGKGSFEMELHTPTTLLTPNKYEKGTNHVVTASYETYVDHLTDLAKHLSSKTTKVPYLELWFTLWSHQDKSKDEPSQTRLTQTWVEIDYTYLNSIQAIPKNGVSSAKANPNLAKKNQQSVFTATPASGFRFEGWYSDEGCTELISHNNPHTQNITSDTTLYAQGAPVPILTVGTPTRSIIGDKNGYDFCSCEFHSDRDLHDWVARATKSGTSPSRSAGILVSSGGSLSTNKTAYIEIDDEELVQGDGVYTITVYGRGTDGYWSDGTYEEL